MQYITFMSQHSLSPIDHLSLRDRVYVRLRRAIVSGELAPGERVQDQELARRMEVSRTPVREALQRLEEEGLIETRRGSSTRVAPIDSQTIRATFPVVAVLHALATRLATPALTEADITDLERANAALAKALTAGETIRAIEADDQFHAVFIQRSGNGELAVTLGRLMPKVRRLEVAQFGSLAGRRSVEQHQAIVAACARHDAPRAADLVEQNWMSLGQLLGDALSLTALAET
ncbi:MAG TPA: GntR family transcriptional regulator [Ktedonobacterales bacterium]